MNSTSLPSATLDSLHKLFAYYKSLGDRTMAQVPDDMLVWQPSPDGNSIAILVRHLTGNMLSRFTDFLTTDGEKDFRDRDNEFEAEEMDRTELMAYWDKGWKCLYEALDSLGPENMDNVVFYIRNEGHLVVEALHRQLGHYAYHVGQMVLLVRIIVGEKWTSLSIPKGGSKQFNAGKLSQDNQGKHFTEGTEEKG